ncbi:proline-rich AKT1 substrate 1 [Pelomyxa schiedti]|nr:proline-rich AKT1 substrate 1 [Pelomyxa schiedti]
MAQEAHGGELPKEAQELAAAQKQPPPEEEAHSPQACSSLSTVSSLPCPNHDTTSDADVEQKPTQNPKNATPSDTAPVDDTGSTTKGDLGPGTTAQATADSTVGGNGGVITGVLDGMFSAVKEIGSAVTTVASSAVSAVLSVGAVSAYDGRPENTKETGTGIGVSGRCTVAPDKAFFTLKFCAVVDRRFAADTVICVGHDFFGGWGQGHLMARELHSGSKRSAKVIASVTFYIPLDDNILVQLSEGSIQYKYAKSDGRLEYEFLYDYSNRLVRPFKQSQLCNGQSFVIHDDLVVFAYSREIASPTLQAYLTWWWNGGFETNIGAQVNPPSAVADLLSVFREIEQIKIHNPRTKKSAQKNEHIFMEPVVQSWLDGLKNSQKPIDLNKLILILLLVQQLKLYKILKPPIIEYFLDQFPTTPIACANVPSAVGQSSRLIEGAISLCVSAYAPHTFSWLLALPFIASANSTQSILYYGVIRIPGIPICHSSATYASVDSSHEHFDVNFARISECEVSSRTASLHAPTWERVLSLSLGFGIDFACFAMMEILEANSKSWIHADELTALFLTKTPLEISKIPICPQKPLELLSKYLSYSVGTRENITALNKYNQAVRFIMNYYLCVSNSSVVHAASSLHNNLQEVISQVALLSTHAYQQICIQENSVNEVMAAFNFLDTIACWPLCDPCVLAAVLQGRRVPADPPSSNSLVESILSVHHLNGLMVVKNYPMLSSVHSPILHKYLKKSQNIFSEMIIAELRHANIEMVLGCVPLPQYLELYTARSLTTEAHFILSECIALVNTTVDKVMKGLLLWHEVQVILNAPVKLSELVGFLPISSLRKPCNIVSQLELYQKVHSQAVDVQHIVKALHKAVGDQFEPKHPLYNVLSWCLSRMAPLDPLNFTKMEQITVLPSLIKEELVCFETLFSSLVFRKMWYQTLKALTSYPAEHSEESVLSHIVLKVCKPAHTEYTALSAAIFSRTASVSNVAKFFSDAADSTLDLELAAMRQEAHVSISLEDIKSQVVASCNIVKVAAVVNSTCILQECLSLRFVSDETWAFMGQIAKCETSNLPLSVITSQVTSLMATLSQISESHLRILHHLSSSSGRELFGFLTSPGVFNEFRSFYDIALASIAAENTKDQDKIKTLAKVNTDLEVLLKARRNATPILNALHSLLGIPNASATAKEIIELSKSVDWLQSLLQQNMGDRGARTVTAMRRLWNLGHLLISHDQVRAYCDAEHFWSLQDLHDMQAVLLLIPQQEELSSTLFAECIGKIHQLQDLHRSMFSSGKPQKPVELGDGVLVWARKLQEYIINCEMELKKWRQLVKAFRSEFYELNLFTTVQLVNIHDVCDFTHLDFEEFELLKRISNSLTSERIQYTLSNISATERYERLWRLFCALKPQSIPNLISSPPCLAFHTFTGSIFHTALTVYYVAKQAPTAETFLLCTEETSDEDVTLLLKRAYFPGRERYMQFCLCDIGKLSVVMQSKIMKYIKQCSSIAVNLVIIGDERCASFTALSGNIKKLPEVSVEQLRDFFFPRITHPSTATPSFSAVVVAGPSGCGKTLTIQRRVRKGAYSYIPIYNANSVTVFSHLPHHPLSEHIHLDLGFFAQGPLGSFLFNLLILKQICGPRGTLRHIPSMAQVYIEVTYPLSAILESNSGNYFFGLLPKMSPLPAPSPTDCSGLDTEIWGIPAFQRVCKLLYCHQGPNCRNVWASQADRMPPNQCVSILLENCGITNPSWRALDFFWKFLSTQSQPIDNSPFCDDVITEWHGFAKFVVKFLITTSRDFACRRQTEALLKSDDITRFNPCKKWHDSEHPTIFFSESSLRFFGFNLDRNGCAITQPGLGLSPEMQGQLIDPNLIPILTHNGVNFNANYESLTRRQRLHILFVSFGICLLEEEAYDPDPCYELTTDNMRKIIAIKLRLESGIPVIISGHTGCGKTALVTFMSSIMPFAILHTMTAHGGVDEDMIRKRLLEIVELAEQDETTTRILV